MALTTYNIDGAHSSIAFSVRHMVFAKVRGQFTRWEGAVAFDDADPSRSSVEATIDAGSIDTHEAQRDGHLKAADFLDVEKFPKIAFKSKRFEAAGKDRYRIVGDLTIKSATKEVTLDTEHLGGGKDPWGNQRIGVSAKTTIDRGDFGLKWNQALETGGLLVGEKVEIEIDLELTKPKE